MGERSIALKDFETEHAAGEAYNGHYDTKAGPLLRQFLAESRVNTTSHSAPPGELQGGESDSLYKVAVLELEQGNITKAKTLFQEVRKRRAAYAGVDEQLSRIRGFEQDVKKGNSRILNGKYEQAVEILTPAAERGRDHANVQAFLGCSHAALYLLSGGENAGMNERRRSRPSAG